MVASDGLTLPVWVRVGEECRWHSKSQKTYHPITVTSIDFRKRRIVVHFKENQKIWKTVPFSQLGPDSPMQPPATTSWVTVESGTSTPPWYEVAGLDVSETVASQPLNNPEEAVQIAGRDQQQRAPNAEQPKEDDVSEDDAATWYDRLREQERLRRRDSDESCFSVKQPAEAEAQKKQELAKRKADVIDKIEGGQQEQHPAAPLPPPAAAHVPGASEQTERGRSQCTTDATAVVDDAWVQLETSTGQTYFWNRLHNSTGWTLPKGVQAKWKGEKGPNDRTYYWNEEGQTVWTLPALSKVEAAGPASIAVPPIPTTADTKIKADLGHTVVSLDTSSAMEKEKTAEPAVSAPAVTTRQISAASAKPSEAYMSKPRARQSLGQAAWNMAVRVRSALTAEPVAPPECAPAPVQLPKDSQPAEVAPAVATAAQALQPAAGCGTQPVETPESQPVETPKSAPVQTPENQPAESLVIDVDDTPSNMDCGTETASAAVCKDERTERAQMLWHMQLKKKGAAAFLWKQALQKASKGNENESSGAPPDFPITGRRAVGAEAVYSNLVAALWAHIGKQGQQTWFDKAATDQELMQELEALSSSEVLQTKVVAVEPLPDEKATVEAQEATQENSAVKDFAHQEIQCDKTESPMDQESMSKAESHKDSRRFEEPLGAKARKLEPSKASATKVHQEPETPLLPAATLPLQPSAAAGLTCSSNVDVASTCESSSAAPVLEPVLELVQKDVETPLIPVPQQVQSEPKKENIKPCAQPLQVPQGARQEPETPDLKMQLQLEAAKLRGELEALARFKAARANAQPIESDKSSDDKPSSPQNTSVSPTQDVPAADVSEDPKEENCQLPTPEPNSNLAQPESLCKLPQPESKPLEQKLEEQEPDIYADLDRKRPTNNVTKDFQLQRTCPTHPQPGTSDIQESTALPPLPPPQAPTGTGTALPPLPPPPPQDGQVAAYPYGAHMRSMWGNYQAHMGYMWGSYGAHAAYPYGGFSSATAPASALGRQPLQSMPSGQQTTSAAPDAKETGQKEQQKSRPKTSKRKSVALPNRRRSIVLPKDSKRKSIALPNRRKSIVLPRDSKRKSIALPNRRKSIVMPKSRREAKLHNVEPKSSSKALREALDHLKRADDKQAPDEKILVVTAEQRASTPSLFKRFLNSNGVSNLKEWDIKALDKDGQIRQRKELEEWPDSSLWPVKFVVTRKADAKDPQDARDTKDSKPLKRKASDAHKTSDGHKAKDADLPPLKRKASKGGKDDEPTAPEDRKSSRPRSRGVKRGEPLASQDQEERRSRSRSPAPESEVSGTGAYMSRRPLRERALPALQMFKSAIANVQKAATGGRTSAEDKQPSKSTRDRPEAKGADTDDLLGKFLTAVRHGKPPGNLSGSKSKENQENARWLGA